MFYGCESLIYLNIYSFKLTNSVEKISPFLYVPSYTKYCINDFNTESFLEIKNSNCSHACFKK